MKRQELALASSLCALVGVLAVISAPACAQEPQLAFHPGDAVHTVIVFEKPTEIDLAVVYFGAQDPVQADQKGLRTDFRCTELVRISPTEWEISGRIPQNIASGKYESGRIDAGLHGATRVYSVGNGYGRAVLIRVSSTEHTNLPDIKSVDVIGEKPGR